MNAQEALDTLVAQLRAALKAAQEEGADAMRRSDFPAARKAAERGEAIQKHMDHLEALRRDLPRLAAEKQEPPAAAPPRAVKGSKTPQREYRIPILRALVDLGGKGAVADVLDRVYRAMEHRLTDVDLQVLRDGRTIRWRNTACWARYHMRLEGLLASDSPQGIWEITDKGREYLNAHGG